MAKTTKTAAKPAKAPKPATICLCGCGGKTGGGQFRPGHDAKLHSAWLSVLRKEPGARKLPKAGADYAREHWGDRKPKKAA